MGIQGLIAKTDRESSDYWLPLWMHGMDTAGIIRKLVRHWLPDSVATAIQMDIDRLEKVSVFLGYIHDIGKATSRFQSVISMRLYELKSRLQDNGFCILQPDQYLYPGKTPHAHAGESILLYEKMNLYIDRSVADIVGAHHGKPINLPGRFDENPILTYPQNYFGDYKQSNIWIDAWDQLIVQALSEARLSSVEEIGKISLQGQVLLSGLLIVADWIASNTEYFPLIGIDELIRPDVYPERVDQAWKKLKFSDVWTPGIQYMSLQTFFEIFGFAPNDVQKQVIEAINNVKSPGVYILEAQMGVGKTEAALSAADILATKFGASGIFFGMPSQATSNGIFPRILEWAEWESEEVALSVRLAHSAAELNEDYEQLLFKGISQIDEIDSTETTGISAHPWFEGSKKSLLANFVIGTVDQFLMSALSRKHFMLRHIGLVGKVVIIDECHAYDAYMNQFLDRALEWMAVYGVPVILLSATLPTDRREKLVDSYVSTYKKYNGLPFLETVKSDSGDWKKSQGYPLLTWTDGNAVHQRIIKQDVKPKTVRFSKMKGSTPLPGYLGEKLSDGGCAVIITNTVKDSQKIYDLLKNSSGLEYCDIMLYHAQYCMPDRSDKENELISRMGKSSSPEQRNGFILVGTQVLEQSLDYDADLMITQTCPMDLLLQRIGRLHRHTRNNRPIKLSEAECVLLMDDEDGYDSGSSLIYGEWLLMRTLKVLPDRIVIPSDIPSLVQKVYDLENDLEMNSAEYEIAREEYLDTIKNQKNKAIYRLHIPRKKQGIRGILKTEDQSSEIQAEAKVRDGVGSIEVFMMIDHGDGYAGFLSDRNNGMIIDMNETPSSEEGRLIARERIRLPYIFTIPGFVDQVIDELEKINIEMIPSWQKSPWLKGKLILLLNSEQRANLCNYVISYNSERGLSYEKAK